MTNYHHHDMTGAIPFEHLAEALDCKPEPDTYVYAERIGYEDFRFYGAQLDCEDEAQGAVFVRYTSAEYRCSRTNVWHLLGPGLTHFMADDEVHIIQIIPTNAPNLYD